MLVCMTLSDSYFQDCLINKLKLFKISSIVRDTHTKIAFETYHGVYREIAIPSSRRLFAVEILP